ncbi:uncharacterized protein CIMG_12187 [Coccidioides immitis RS]|uniref:Uncharacterized protein n=1 Tax=Coccidioides immitis (strain RS) TaxID=246410 RepID=A0A0D8JTZ1_COCIM|nr:uncharacterized protein CIMG_12187 [Coccidioides immitis RS]KJF60752.1 hypothetical protein CIMG_12187 [Coccidioides immitis RS]
MSTQRLRPSGLFSLWQSPRRNFMAIYSIPRGFADMRQTSPPTGSSIHHETASRNERSRDTAGVNDQKDEPKMGYDPERMTRERSELFELFSLSRIPDPRTDLGVKIDELGQLQITDPVESRRKHKTALVLSAVPISLVERDFRRLLDPGKHIEGWTSGGGLEEIIPARDPQTLRRKHGWILIFATPAAAQEYQARIHNLRVLLRHHLPITSESKLQLPPAYTVHGSRGFTLQDYTISSPWQYPSVLAYLAPFSDHLQEVIKTHNNILAQKQKERRTYPVQISLDTRQIPNISTRHIVSFVHWDAENRRVPWRLAETLRPISPLTNATPHRILDSEEDAKILNGIGNWRILFENSSEARRFVRTWHRRPLPKFTGLPNCDPPPLLHVECLFRDGY